MQDTSKQIAGKDANYFLDITGEVCPLTFVRTKLLIERMVSGEIAEIRLKGAEPLRNVPRSVQADGHAVLSFEPEDPTAEPTAVHRLVLRKA